MNSSNTQDRPQWTTTQAARRYQELGYTVLALHENSKRPIGNAWGIDPKPPTRTAQNIGLALAHSRVAVLDVDDFALSAPMFDFLSLELDTLDAPQWSSGKPNRAKFLFAAPAFPHSRRVLAVTRNGVASVAFELRGGDGQLQDVLPPSTVDEWHYRWQRAPGRRDVLPPLPRQLIALWTDFDRLAPILQRIAGCERALASVARSPRRQQDRPAGRPSVIGDFNATVDIGDVLERAGYQQARDRAGMRSWLRPGSESGIPGAVELQPNHVFSHAGEFGPHLCDAFDVFMTLHHGGDFFAALGAAREVIKQLKG